MSKKYSQRIKYTLIDGKLCIQHYLLLQRLTFNKKVKTGEYKEYNSYHIKFPRAIYDLLQPEDNQLYLKQLENGKILVLTEPDDAARKVKIQKTNKKQNSSSDNRTYSITIPKKLLVLDDYRQGEVFILCQIIADNETGYTTTLERI